ncbi:hypothetical protein [Microbacterium sulfonylureivorans]|nr:hypothetical protein [Microbacterium sulfonylureivorans]
MSSIVEADFAGGRFTVDTVAPIHRDAASLADFGAPTSSARVTSVTVRTR